MKTIAVLMWLFCRAGIADYGIYVSSLEECEAMGPAVMEELHALGESPMLWVCEYIEAPISQDMCYP